VSPDVAELKDMVKALLLDKKGQNQSPAPVKAVEEICVTFGGAHSYRNCPATNGNNHRDNIQKLYLKPPHSGTLPSNTIANPKSDLKAITTRSCVSYDGPQISPKVVENKPEATKDTVNPTNNDNTKDVQPQAVQSESPVSISKPVTSPISEPEIAPIFKDMSFKISFPDALILMPKFALTLKALIGNKEKLSEMARNPINEHCSVVLLKKLLEKLGDPGKFLIPCDFPDSLPDLTPTCMTLELVDRSISRPVRVAEDVYVKVGDNLDFNGFKLFMLFDLDHEP
nr:hypothetical protein [Tanacetum cinerariifolium]